MEKSISSSLKIVFIYSLFSAAWILFSDLTVEAVLSDAELITRVQTIKGWLFVLVTALLLYVLMSRNYQAVERVFQLDGLTGLLNHNMLKRQLDRRIATLGKGQKMVVGYMDIDGFKEVNQTLGFERADGLILQLARAIEGFARLNSIIGRLPPDQFVVAREFEPGEDIDLRVRGYQALFNKVAQEFGVEANCSIGVAICPDDGDSAKSLMNAAGAALTVAKEKGNAVEYHDKTLTAVAAARRTMLKDLKTALEEQSLFLAYQPKYNIASGKVSGVEVLIRWSHPLEGFVAPDQFIPLAEEAGLSAGISKFVISRAADELEQSGLLGKQIKHVAINISATEFNHPEQMDELLAYIKQHPVLAPFVRIEITETATLRDMKRSAEIINIMRNEGVGLSIDDFGTGYTSLAMLKDFTIDEIKIDRSFVSGMDDGRSKTIISAIIGMAGSFGINVVAEGVETQQQLQALDAMGCKEAQGYHLGRPMGIKDLLAHVAS